MLQDNPVLRMRSADVVEKVSRIHPEYLQPYKDRLIKEVSRIKQQEVRWHAAQMFSYLKINRREKKAIVKLLSGYIETEKSRIVQVNSMQTMANLAADDSNLRPMVIRIIEKAVETGSPAVINRGQKLLIELESVSKPS